MLTHPRSTLHVLRRLMRLHSGHVTLLEAKLQPPKKRNCPPSRTESARQPQVGLCPKFVVLANSALTVRVLNPSNATVSLEVS